MSFLLTLSLLCGLKVAESRVAEQQHPFSVSATTSFNEHRLNFSSPAPHIFSSVHGLLRQGYNTFFPNGFSVVACEIPAFTPLYHGWLNDEPPKSPEWLATTPEMAYGIMGSTQNSFLSTYRTTRPVKCLYFDGASGALGENGTMDMQMLFLFGNTTGPPGKHSDAEFLWNEYARAQHFCEWLHENDFDNPGRGVEGIVRMSAGFEVIWCNFSSPSIQLVSQLNASVPLLGHNRTFSSNKGKRVLTTIDRPAPDDLPAPDWEIDWDREPFVASQQWDWFTSISRTYSSDNLASARDLSTRLLAADVVSLYSPEFEKHLAALVRDEREQFKLTLGGHLHDDDSPESRRDTVKRLLRRRAGHRVGNISAHEIGEFRTNVKLMLTRVVSKASEDAQRWSADSWSHTSDMIVDNFAKRLMKLQQLLEEGEGSTGERESQYSIRKSFASLRERAHVLLMPFFEYSSHPEVALGSEKIQASLDRCKRQYLPPFSYKEQSKTAIKGSTRGGYIGQAIEEVMHNICVVLVGMGNSIEMTWLKNFNGKIQNPSKEQQQIFRVEIRTWHRKIEELTAWLGWAPHWMGCDRLCEWDEECYIPIWPLLRQMSAKKPAYGNTPIDQDEVEYDLWHPRCLGVADFATG